MKTVKTCSHIKTRTLNTIRNGKTSIYLFKNLTTCKNNRQSNSQHQRKLSFFFITKNYRMMTSSTCCTRSQQNNSIQKRDFKSWKNLDILRRSNGTNLWCRPHCRSKKCSKKGKEKHNFRYNKKDHTLSKTQLN